MILISSGSTLFKKYIRNFELPTLESIAINWRSLNVGDFIWKIFIFEKSKIEFNHRLAIDKSSVVVIVISVIAAMTLDAFSGEIAAAILFICFIIRNICPDEHFTISSIWWLHEVHLIRSHAVPHCQLSIYKF